MMSQNGGAPPLEMSQNAGAPPLEMSRNGGAPPLEMSQNGGSPRVDPRLAKGSVGRLGVRKVSRMARFQT
jgi:hypothetical protein